MFMKQAIAFP